MTNKIGASVLTAAEILAVEDREIKMVSCPEWGGEVHVRSLSTMEMLDLELAIRNTDDVQLIMAAQFAAMVCDEAGVPLFSTAENARSILNRRLPIVRRLIDAGMALNKLGS